MCPGRCRRFPVVAVVKRVFKPSFPLVDRSSPVNARFAKKRGRRRPFLTAGHALTRPASDAGNGIFFLTGF
jgi:hypothetical protein